MSSGGFGAAYRASDRQIRNHGEAVELLHLAAVEETEQENALRELSCRAGAIA